MDPEEDEDWSLYGIEDDPDMWMYSCDDEGAHIGETDIDGYGDRVDHHYR